MRNTHVLSLISLVCCCFSCTKPEIVPLTSQCTGTEWWCDTIVVPKIIWRVPQGTATNDQLTINPTLHNNIVVFSYTNDALKVEALIGLDKASGKKIWETKTQTEFISGNTLIDNKIIIQDERNFTAVSMNDGAIVGSFKDTQPYGVDHTTFYNYIYAVRYTYDYYKGGPSSIVRIDKNLKKIESISTYEGKKDKINSCYPPTIWYNQKDTIMIYISSSTGYMPGEDECYINGIDIKTRKKIWQTQMEGISGGNTRHLVINDKIILSNANFIYCLNMNTGNIVWKKYVNSLITTANYVKIGNKIYFTDNEGKLYCVSIITGETIYALDGYGGNNSEMLEYKGILYFNGGNGRLFAVEAETGKKLWEQRSPNWLKRSYANFSLRGLVIDIEKGCLYAADRVEIFCFELAKK